MYDVSAAFRRIEDILIADIMAKLAEHKVDDDDWEQWSIYQLLELQRCRQENAERFDDDFSDINEKVGAALLDSYKTGEIREERKIIEQILKGNADEPKGISAKFYGINDGKMSALLDAVEADFTRGEQALLRVANDEYRQIIFDAQVFAGAGATYEQAVDMATKDFLRNGIQCITYKNGARHTIESYAEMALRTGQKRAYLMGEGNANDRYGIHTVRVNRRTNACPKCVKWLGRVLVDDVYSGGTAQEAEAAHVPTLSQAMAEGFLHPNCKDIYSLYIDGVSKPPKPWSEGELKEIADNYNKEQAVTHAKDMTESYDRMAKHALDPANKARYEARAESWKERIEELENDNRPQRPAVSSTG